MDLLCHRAFQGQDGAFVTQAKPSQWALGSPSLKMGPLRPTRAPLGRYRALSGQHRALLDRKRALSRQHRSWSGQHRALSGQHRVALSQTESSQVCKVPSRVNSWPAQADGALPEQHRAFSGVKKRCLSSLGFRTTLASSETVLPWQSIGHNANWKKGCSISWQHHITDMRGW